MPYRNHLLVMLAFSLPFGRRISMPIFVVWATLTCLYLVVNKNWRISKEFGKYPLMFILIPPLYYLLNVIGLVHTQDLHQGFFELEKKVSMLIIPVLFLFDRAALTPIWIRRIFGGFCAGLTLASLVSIGLGFYNSISKVNGHIVFRTAVNDISDERGYNFFQQVTQGGNYFFDQYISPFMHMTYYGMYLSFGVIIYIWLSELKKRKAINYFLALLLLVVMLLTDSRGAILSFAVSLLILGILFIKRKYFRYGLPILVAMTFTVISLSPRSVLLFEDLSKTIKEINYESTESAALRIVVWKAAQEVIAENFLFGVGTGDADSALLAKTLVTNRLAFENKLNAHNEYMQTFMTLGLLGIVVLFTLLLTLFFYSLKKSEPVFVAFILIVGFNMLFESLLETFQGIFFISLFFSVSILYFFGKENENPAVS